MEKYISTVEKKEKGGKLMLERIKGGLFGLAIGDALGAPVEFMTAEEIEEQYGQVESMIGGGWLHLEPGQVTDDTQMMLCIARGILRNPVHPLPAVGEEFVRWYSTNPPDIGKSCQESIKLFLEMGNWHQASMTAHQSLGQSGGNGSLMRTLPIALAYQNQFDMMLQLTSDISKMTHWEEITEQACQIYSCIVLAYLKGRDEKEELITQMLDLYETTSGLLEMRNIPPSGYVRDSLYHALMSFIRTDSFEDCLIRAVNLGGDADSIGAIAGGLAGVYYGYQAIPTDWIMELDPAVRDELTELSTKLAEFVNAEV